MSHQSERARRRTQRVLRRGVARVALAVLIGSLATISSGTPAAAAPEAYGFDGSLGTGDTWLGSYSLSGQYVFCAAQTANGDPASQGTNFGPVYWLDGSDGDSWTGSYSGTQPTLWVSSSPAVQSGANLNQANTSNRVQNGSTLTGSNLNRIGYVLATYGRDTSGSTAAVDTRHARVRMLIMEKFEVMYYGIWDNYLQSTGSGTHRSAVNAMWNDAIANAGPYTAASGIAVTVDGDGMGGVMSGVEIRSAANNRQSGIPYTAIITSGNATWDATGTSTVTGTSSSASTLSHDFTAISGVGGIVTVQLQFQGVPDHQVGIRESTSGGQDVMYGRTINMGVAAESDESVFLEFEYEIVTTTSEAVALPGTELTDTLEVTVTAAVWDPPGHEVTVTSTLYGPLDEVPVEQATVPVGTPVVGSVDTIISGEGTYVTPPITITEPGFYVWHETAPADVNAGAWSGRFGVASEITLVRWSPELSTTISTDEFRAGDDVSDNVTVTDAQPDSAVEVTATLYHSPGTLAPTQQSTVPVGATVVGSPVVVTVTTDGNGDGSGTTPAITIPGGAERGWYTWVVSTEETATMNAYVSDFGIPAETGVYPWSLEVVTTISSSPLEVNVDVSDDFAITGGPPGETVTITGDLYRDADVSAAPVEQATVPGDATLVATSSVDVTFDSAGQASGTLPAVSHGNVPGWYTWVVAVPSSDILDEYTSAYGVASETAQLRAAPLASTVASHTVVIDDPEETGGLPSGRMTLIDTVVVDGLPADYGTLADEVTPITVDLYFVHHSEAGELSTMSTMCTSEYWLASATVPATNGTHVARSDDFVIDMTLTDQDDGYYMFVHSHPGSDRIDAFEGVCAESSETLYLTPSAIMAGLARTGVDDVAGMLVVAGSALGLGGLLLGFSLVRRSRAVAMSDDGTTVNNDALNGQRGW